MNTKMSKIAAVLAFIIGGMAIFSGGKALFVQDPDYYVIDWLLIYNFSMGLVTFLVTAVLLWKNSRYGLSAAIITIGLHTTVMLLLQTVFRDVVASESIRAMTIRITTWGIILGFLLLQSIQSRRLVVKQN